MILLKKTLYLSLAVVTAAFLTIAFAAEKPGGDKRGKQSLEKGAGIPRHQILNINNITTWSRSDGESNHSPGGDNGVYYPVGTGNVVYEDGIVFGSKLFLNAARTQAPSVQPIRVGGGTYLSNVGTKAGYVTGLGAAAVAADPNAADVRYYRIRRDYAAMTEGELRFDAQTSYELTRLDQVTTTQIEAIRAQYELDWKEWPVAKGAPYIDRNNNGKYDPPPAFGPDFTVDSLIAGNYDEPGVAGADPSTPADQVMFTIYNDLDRALSLRFEGSNPTGLEIQITSFAYKRTDALGNVYFKRLRITNKGGVDIGAGQIGAFYIDSMYVCQWSDIDLGDAFDDLAGCDTTRSIAFIYNALPVDATFVKYGLPPPCSAYDFLAGPLVPGAPTDSAIVDFKRVYGKKNLPMTGFSYFSAGSPYSDPPFNNYETGAGRWWKMLRGYAPLGTITEPDKPYNYPPAVGPSKFPLSGDPVTGSGWVDGLSTDYSFVTGDRRILLNTGPFRLDPGESQEIYIGFVVGMGADRLSSVAVMKANDKAVQETFDLLFRVAKPPANPVVSVSEMDGKVILEWGSNAGAVAATETRVVQPGDYHFEGYNVYQFPSAGARLSDAVRLATYDAVNGVKVVLSEEFDLKAAAFLKVPIQFGSDAGVKRYFVLDKDYVRDINKLYNGQEYYLAVTAYSYTSLGGYLAALESSPNIITVRPKLPALGTRIVGAAGVDTARVVSGNLDKPLLIQRIDPSKFKTTTYQIGFKDTAGALQWALKDKSTGAVLTQSMNLGAVISGDANDDNNFPLINGVIPLVKQVEPAIRSDSTRWLNNGPKQLADGARLHGGPAFHDGYITIASDGSNYLGQYAPTFSMAKLPRIELRFGPGNESKAYRLRRTGAGTAYVIQTDVKPVVAPNGEGFVAIPFSAWEVGGASGKGGRQLTISWRDQSADALWNPPADGDGVEVIFIHNRSYDPDGKQFTYPTNPDPAKRGTAIANECTKGDIMYLASLAATDQTFKFDQKDVLYVRPWFGFNSAVVAEFSTQGPTFDAEVQKKDAETRVGVFPNPYYASNIGEESRFDRYVTFNNLPKVAKIRIFNLAGHLVRVLDKDDNSQFVRWNLMNMRNYPVASGVYIAYVDFPDIGTTKILKFSIIQEQEILDRY